MARGQRRSRATLQQLFDFLSRSPLRSTPSARTDLFRRPMSSVPVSDFFGAIPRVAVQTGPAHTLVNETEVANSSPLDDVTTPSAGDETGDHQPPGGDKGRLRLNPAARGFHAHHAPAAGHATHAGADATPPSAVWVGTPGAVVGSLARSSAATQQRSYGGTASLTMSGMTLGWLGASLCLLLVAAAMLVEARVVQYTLPRVRGHWAPFIKLSTAAGRATWVVVDGTCSEATSGMAAFTGSG